LSYAYASAAHAISRGPTTLSRPFSSLLRRRISTAGSVSSQASVCANVRTPAWRYR
jgi:hypothetical protein